MILFLALYENIFTEGYELGRIATEVGMQT